MSSKAVNRAAAATVEELARRFSDRDSQQRLLQLIDYVTLLRHSIIAADYKIPDDLTNAIALTDYGTRVRQDLVTKHDVPPKEAKLMCFLQIAAFDLIIDIEKTDLESLNSAISRQIRESTIRFPMIYGGHLYRRAAELFPEMRSRLSVSDTSRLLNSMPCGVFQVGNLVVGPLGILHSDEARWIPPTTTVPLQHCGDLTCRRVHHTRLSTDYRAQINHHLPKMSNIFGDPDDGRHWTEFVNSLIEASVEPWDDYDMSGVPVALGDCLTEQELIRVAETLNVGAPDLSGAELRATLMQRLWSLAGSTVAHTVDELIAERKIVVPQGEVRQARLADVQMGAYNVAVQIGEDGIRLQPSSRDLPILRLRRLVGALYDVDDRHDADELKWQLRAVDRADLDEQLDEYLRISDPAEAIRVLVLARRSNLRTAMEQLRFARGSLSLGEDGPADSDEIVVRKLMWKLGFRLALRPSAAREYWNHYGEARRVIDDSRASAVLDMSHVRGALTNLFVSLEGLLDDSLGFAWWALTADHARAERPFVYTASMSTGAWTALATHVRERNPFNGFRLPEGEARTLKPLAMAFGALGSFLEDVSARAQEYERAPEAIPKWASGSRLHCFNFLHIIPFLDLTESSRRTICEGLDEISTLLVEGKVAQVRNDVSHFRRSSIDWLRVTAALEATRLAIERLESMGLIRDEYRAVMSERDQWERATVLLRSASGAEVSLALPSRSGSVGLPAVTVPQYVVRAAIFANPLQMLRFRAGAESDFSDMWSGVPSPRRPSTRLQDQMSDVDGITDAFSVMPEA